MKFEEGNFLKKVIHPYPPTYYQILHNFDDLGYCYVRNLSNGYEFDVFHADANGYFVACITKEQYMREILES